jgi:tetratricopeptide (TPR) repeat protein
MGKALKKKKKLIHEGHIDERRITKSPGNFITLQIKKVFPKFTLKIKLLLMIVIIALSSFAVYFNSFYNGFVFDDTFQVIENHWITDVKYFPDIFSNSVWAFRKGSSISNYYRPLMHVIYMLNYHIFGLKPWGFHLVNILFHAGVSLLAFIVTLRLFGDSQYSAFSSSLIPPFIAAMLFVTHPIHTEAVTWIAGLPDLSFSFFYLLSFYLYIRSGTEFKISYLFSVASFFLAALSKEPALTLPIILIAYDYASKKFENGLSTRTIRYIPYLVVAGIYFILRFHALGGFAPHERHHAELSYYQYFINVFPLFMQYLKKLILPMNLNALYVFHPISSISEVKGIASLIITVAFVVLGFIAMKKNKMVFFSLSLIAVPLLPALYIPALGEYTFAERYLYLPSLGFVSLIALLASLTKVDRLPKGTISLIVMFTMLIGLYSLGTVSRNTVWRNNFVLYADMIKKSPDASFPHYNLAVNLQKEGLIEEAIEQYQIALKIDPDEVDAYQNLGFAFLNKGLPDKAIEEFQIALKLNPDLADAHNGIGTAFLVKGLTDKAIEQYQIALKLNPDLADAHNNLGIIYKMSGSIDKAIDEYQAAVRLHPSDSAYRSNLTKAYELKNLSQ